MALATSPTLLELRQSLATRLNLGAQASSSQRLHPLLDEFLRSAFELLVRDAHWVILRTEVQIDLVVGQHDYDVPDRIEIGGIERVTVIDENFHEWALRPGVNVHERNAYRVDRGGEFKESQASTPLRWEVIDQLLRIYPAPDDRFLNMLIRGQAIPRTPRSNTDRALIDGEAHLLQALVQAKAHFNMPGVQATQHALARHLRNMQAAQSDGDSVLIGPPRSARFSGDHGRSHGLDRRLFYPDFDPDFHQHFFHH